ncbi:MAG: nicotinamide-nucleotide amidase [Planctomycetota bacterium]|jgi:nicotinamide-nucleotide amidase
MTSTPAQGLPPEPIDSAVVVAVGDELLAGAHPDLNAPELARFLGSLGVAVREVRVVADDVEAIAQALLAGAQKARLVFVTGGLGPTLDDVTRDGVAQAAGVGLYSDRGAIADLENWYAGRDLPMPESNRRQALFPVGATMIPNGSGTAPGFRICLGDSWVVSLPGPPREMRHVLGAEVLPWLRRENLVGKPLMQQKAFLFGVPEGAFAERAGDWMGRAADPLISCSAKAGSLWITLRAAGTDPALGEARLSERMEDLRGEFGDAIYSESEPCIGNVLGEALRSAGVSFTTAESCTGGRVAGLLTNTAGISEVFERGFVTYADAAKHELLGVDRAILEEHGAVSEEVAAAMALGAAREARARLAVSVTGIAGPDGGSPGKPVGLVWFATALDGVVETFRRELPALGRDWVRGVATQTALYRSWLRLHSAGLAPVRRQGTRD